jgi:hypothetical protein
MDTHMGASMDTSELRDLNRRLTTRLPFTVLTRSEMKNIREAVSELLRLKSPAPDKNLLTRIERALVREGMTLDQAKRMSVEELVANVEGIGTKAARKIHEM